MSGIYVDCSAIPYKAELFFPFIKEIKASGIEYLFIDFGQYLPWSEDFRFDSSFRYPEDFISALDRKAHDAGLNLIPVISFEEDNTFIAKEPSCRFLVPGFPDNLVVDPEAAGASLFFEEILEDAAGLFYHAPGFLLFFPGGFAEKVRKGSGSAVSAVEKLRQYAESLGKKLYCKDISCPEYADFVPAGRNEKGSYYEDLYLFAFEEGEKSEVRKFVSYIGFLPFSFLEYLAAGRNHEIFDDDSIFIKQFLEKEDTVWNLYRSAAWKLSALFLNNKSNFSVGLLQDYKVLSVHAEDYMEMSEDGSNRFSGHFESFFCKDFFYARTEAFFSLFYSMEREVNRIIRRIGR